jgi:hypothetical protein
MVIDGVDMAITSRKRALQWQPSAQGRLISTASSTPEGYWIDLDQSTGLPVPKHDTGIHDRD